MYMYIYICICIYVYIYIYFKNQYINGKMKLIKNQYTNGKFENKKYFVKYFNSFYRW